MTVELGDECTDTVTGFKGICVARTQWLIGCVRIMLQPPVDKEGKVPDAVNFDEPTLKVTKRGKIKVADTAAGEKPGGPIPLPRRVPAAKRA